jgi:hypothetical protein
VSSAFAYSPLIGLATPELQPDRYGNIPAILRDELNAETDRDVLARMEHLARKKRMRQPDISDEQMADYLALAENCKNFKEWLKFRANPGSAGGSPGAVAWFVGVLTVVGVLTAGLIAAIAISAL